MPPIVGTSCRKAGGCVPGFDSFGSPIPVSASNNSPCMRRCTASIGTIAMGSRVDAVARRLIPAIKAKGTHVD